MQNIDLKYVCTIIGNLSGIPVRLFEKRSLVLSSSLVALPKDPLLLYQEDILEKGSNLGYFITPFFDYYGFVKSDESQIIIGPTRQIPAQEKDLRELAFRLDLTKEDADTFVHAVNCIVRMPLESLMQILCVLNYILNDEKLGLKDIAIYEDAQAKLVKTIEGEKMERQFSQAEPEIQQDVHNTFATEQALMSIIEKGDTAALREWISHAPAMRAGVVADSQLRQQKNIFIVSATLASRHAIQGGMDVEEAMSLSDSYIQKCELLNEVTSLTNLQYRMVLDFTEHVERIRLGKHPSKLTIDVSNYIQHHLSEPITTEEIAKHLFLSRSRLSVKFKQEAGITLNDYILSEKIEEAKRLLRYSGKSMLSISLYLGFSSQSHFSRVFKKYAGMTPNEYKESSRLR